MKQKGQVLQKIRLIEISHLALFGNVQVTAQAVQELCDREIPICYFSYGGWFRGITNGMGHKNVELRCRQYLGATTPETALSISRRMVFGKIKNSRTMLRRNHREPPPSIQTELNRLAERALTAQSLETLLGIEGSRRPHLFLGVSRHDQERIPGLRLPWAETGVLPRTR